MMRAQVGHQVTLLLNNSSSLPAGALEDSRSNNLAGQDND